MHSSDTYAYTFLPRHAYASGVACCTRWSAGSAAAVGTHTHGRTTNAACAHHIVPLSAPDASLRYMIDTSTCYLFGYIFIYMYIYFLYGSALIRAVGTTAHAGAVTTVPHGCPAVIRAGGTTAHAGAVATVPHGCPAMIRAIGTTDRFRQRFLPSGTPDRHATGRGLRPPNGNITRAAGRREDQKGRRHNGRR
jgi:hypothetical protein